MTTQYSDEIKTKVAPPLVHGEMQNPRKVACVRILEKFRRHFSTFPIIWMVSQ